jgi:hypothetical protein
MPLRLANRVKESSTTTGSGTITLGGATGAYQTFSNALSNGDTTYYTVVNGDNWEVGIGTYSSNTLTRDAVLSSSNSNNKINLGGSSSVFIAYPSEKSVYKDQNNQVIAGSSGIIIAVGIPSNVSNVLYNVSGTLYFNGSGLAGNGGISNLVEDTSPQLGGNLDLNSSSITGVGDLEINGMISGINGVFNSGITFNDGVPSNTSNTLYNNSGILYFGNTVVGSKKQYENISSDRVITNATDIFFVDSSMSQINVYLPLASGNGGRELKIKRSSGNNLVTIYASGLENIDGQTTFTMHHLYQATTLMSNNSNWFIT